MPVHTSHPTAREKRRCYTLGPVLSATDVPSEVSSTSAVPSYSQNPSTVSVSRPPPVTGPDRSQRITRQARLRTRHLPPRPKEQASTNRASVTPPRAAVVSVNAPTEVPSVRTPTVETLPITVPVVEIPPIVVSQLETLRSQVGASAADPCGLMEPNTTSTPNHPSDTTSVSDDCASDSGSYTSTLLDVFDVGMDDLEPPATGPWMAIDHLTGEIIADDNNPAEAIPANTQTGIEVGILPRLGIHVLTETEPPTLLFEDEEVRPEWLISAVKKFLRYAPYYGCLGKVVDLFLAQEARLGYPNLVINLYFLRSTRILTHTKSVRRALPSSNRPIEVGEFQKWARGYSRGDNVDAERFGTAVLKWWLTIQPTTRKQWPPTHNPLPNDFSFDYFNRGGPNGVFLVILCLGWWANALTADMDLTNYTLVTNDVRWVLEQIASRA